MKEIYREIERLRREMISCAERKGLTDPKVLEISRQIDYYLNLLMKKEHEQKSRFPYGKIYEERVRYAV